MENTTKSLCRAVGHISQQCDRQAYNFFHGDSHIMVVFSNLVFGGKFAFSLSVVECRHAVL